MKQIPTIMDSQEILDKAFRRVKKIEVRNLRKVGDVKSESISRVSAFSHTLSAQLEKYVKAFPSMDNLPDFHFALIDLRRFRREALARAVKRQPVGKHRDLHAARCCPAHDLAKRVALLT